MRKTISILAAAVLLAACGTTPTTQESTSSTTASAPAPVDSGKVATVQAQTPTGSSIPEVNDPNNILSKRTVLFAYDDFAIDPQYNALIQAHARFLASRPDIKILIQGHADERGSHEYNLALGQKRAEALRQALVLQGVKDPQIEAVSLGEEKPAVDGHDESAWSQNRRDYILYPGEY